MSIRVSGARREAAPDERRVICEICKVSYGAHHYEQYHKHRCKTETTTESFQAPRSLQEGENSTWSEESSVPIASFEIPCPEADDVESDWRSSYAHIKESCKTSRKLDVLSNVSDEDLFSFFPAVELNSENLSDSEHEEQWEANEEREMAENMEEGIAQDLDEVAEQLSSRPATVQDKVQTFTRWLCLFLMVWQARFFISDLAINTWMTFFREMLSVFAEPGNILGLILTVFPSGVYGIYKLFGHSKDPFRKLVVCRKCYTMYNIKDCFQIIEGRTETKKCSFIKYPWQRHQLQRNMCAQPLLKEVTLPSGTRRFYPFKWFCCRSIKESLREMVSRPGFEDLCEKWRDRNIPEGKQEDVMDGKVWKEFNGEKYNFFTQERCYGLMLNVDWFRPFKHVQYSVGAVYLTILNLPKPERYKRKNVILAGIIPHMGSEPKTNTFLSYLVEELKEAWLHGFSLQSVKQGRTATFCLALLAVACDIPACRKVCGFLGHAANRGCSKCWKLFPGQVGQKDYSGFARDAWPQRTHERHLEWCAQILDKKTKQDVKLLEREYGVRYSVLLELPYFDIVQMHVIDPMHNLFLGTAKHVIEIWKEQGVLTDKDMKSIQEKIDDFEVPSDLGRIPNKIQSGFASFTADQWKNWTLYFSIPCLTGILPSQHLEIWKHFVKACYLLCSYVMTHEMLVEADLELITFCKMFEEKYGSDYVTPNMHLHGHIKECIIGYGPVYAFWLFSFERYNGILGNEPSNQRSVELQFMRRFLRDGLFFGQVLEVAQGEETLANHLNMMQDPPSRGSLQDMMVSDLLDVCRISSRLTCIREVNMSVTNLISYMKKTIWDLPPLEVQKLESMYQAIYAANTFTVVASCFKVKQLRNGGLLLGSKGSKTNSSSFIMAYWTDVNGVIYSTPGHHQELAAGQILFFIEHNLLFHDGTIKKHILARVQWYLEMEPVFKDYYGFPVSVFYPNIYTPENSASFIPVQRIKCKIVRKTETLKIHHLTRQALITVPRDHFAGV